MRPKIVLISINKTQDSLAHIKTAYIRIDSSSQYIAQDSSVHIRIPHISIDSSSQHITQDSSAHIEINIA